MASKELSLEYWVLLFSALQADDPELSARAYHFLKERLQSSEQWDPALDKLFHRRFDFWSRYRRRAEEGRQIALAALEGFREYFETAINQRLAQHESTLDAIKRQLDALDETVAANHAEYVINSDAIASTIEWGTFQSMSS